MKGKLNHLYRKQCDCDEARPYRLEIDLDGETAFAISRYIYQNEGNCEIEVKSSVSSSINSPTECLRKMQDFCYREPKHEVIFNEPATILYKDGKKYVCKCDKQDKFSEELGLALCLLKSFGVSYSDFEELLKGAKRQGVKNGSKD